MSPAGTGVQMRVLFFEPYPMGLGGNFQTQMGFASDLRERRHEVIIMSPQEGAALDRFRQAGFQCVVMPPPASIAPYGRAVLASRWTSRARAVLDVVRYNLELARVIRRERVDVVYANCVRAALSCGLAAKAARRRILLYVKGELSNPFLDRLCLLLCDRVLFFCAANRDDRYRLLTRLLGRKIGVLHIGLDPTLLTPTQDPAAVRSSLGIEADGVNAVVLAQLYPPKGQHLAIEAMARVVVSHPNARLYLVGDEVIKEYSGYRRELDELIARLGLQGRVHFTGWRHDAADILRQMDLVLHPSLSEGFGRAVLESMALGLPVVASRVGGLREAIVDGENGFLVEPGDVAGLARRWSELLEDRDLRARLGARARRTVLERYRSADQNAKFTQILGRLAGATASKSEAAI